MYVSELQFLITYNINIKADKNIIAYQAKFTLSSSIIPLL